MEDARLQEMLRQTIANSKSKAYRYLMHELFTQSVPVVADYMYDMDIQKVCDVVTGNHEGAGWS